MWPPQQYVPSRDAAETTEEGGFNSSSSVSSTSSMGIISPKSPPAGSLDLYGKRRQLVKVQLLEKEIGLLQDELKSINDVQAASGCVKELDDFLRAKPDPFVAPNEEAGKSDHWWKRFQSTFCCSVPTNRCCFRWETCRNISLCSKKKRCCRRSQCCSGCLCAICASNWRCCIRLPSCCCGCENSRSRCCDADRTLFSCSCL